MLRFAHIVKLADGFNGIEIRDYPPANYWPKLVEKLPEPEPHVAKNIELMMSLEVEYLETQSKFQVKKGNSTIAFKKFYERFGKPKEQIRREYFEELEAAIAGLEPVAENAAQKVLNYEDSISEFGGRFVGCSIVSHRSVNRRTVLVDE